MLDYIIPARQQQVRSHGCNSSVLCLGFQLNSTAHSRVTLNITFMLHHANVHLFKVLPNKALAKHYGVVFFAYRLLLMLFRPALQLHQPSSQ